MVQPSYFQHILRSTNVLSRIDLDLPSELLHFRSISAQLEGLRTSVSPDIRDGLI
jgi:hypothetical protein